MTQKLNKHYPEVNPNPNFPELEKKILVDWAGAKTFEKSVENRKGKEFVFYDGPPFANGLPHYGHLLTGFVKDTFARYQTMQGKRVERRFGWDCHGLPAEMGSEKELGISGRQAIQAFGIEKFNEHCRESVMKYTSEWREYVTRQARWVDFDNDYKTMDRNFMESVLWAFKQLYDKGLVYEAHRVMPYSWAAETPLSNFETKLDNSYREREDKAITVAFELNEKPKGAPDAEKYYILAWTTTPWTLPSNLALAVNAEMDYAAILKDKKCYIIVGTALNRYAADFEIEKVNSGPAGDDLLGLTYKPLFPYFADHPNAFRILDGSSFVTDGDGAGIVHLAPAFGEDDQKCCEANGIDLVCPVDGQGKYTDAIFDLPTLSLKGLNVISEKSKGEGDTFNEKQIEKYGLANLRIIRYLKNYQDGTNRVVKEEEIKHNYPHCWRTDTPLIYRAMPSWYVEVTKFRDRAVEINKQINWIPEHIRDGQMGHMLATAPDWSISRNRFWGTPIPVWRRQESGIRNQESDIKVFGSIAELEGFFGVEVKDLHRPFIDTLTTAKDGSKWQRVEDVFDCWFESGSMPFAQVHYPFENKEWFEHHFPADFITEYVGQTRGWFNTLIMLSTALFDKPPFKNCICHGVMLGEPTLDPNTGKMRPQKLSKRLKNYPEPFRIFDEYGADSLRWFMLSSAVMRGQDLQIDKEGKFIRDVVRLAIKPIWNAYNFFCLYANADGVEAKLLAASGQRPENIMDNYIMAKCAQAVADIEKSLDAYDAPAACEAVTAFFETLNNWYIRRSKERFWKTEHDADKQAAYDTLYTVLVTMCKAAAPLLPITLEEIYKNLTGKESVHLSEFPSLRASGGEAIQSGSPRGDAARDDDLISDMERVMDICNAVLSVRSKLNIRVRQPLASLTIVGAGGYNAGLADIIKDEINVKNLAAESDISKYATLKLSINSAVLGKRLPEKMKQILPASKKGEWKQLAGGEVEICGEVLLPAEYTLQLEPKAQYQSCAQALSTNDALVILDTAITPELEAEGLSRDVVRMIQQARKDANLNVSDKILLYVGAAVKVVAAVSTHRDYIMEQTLAVQMLAEMPQNATFTAKNELDGAEVAISFVVAN